MNIYVGNLDFKVSENDLEELFEPYGTVSSVKMITDKYSGRSKGFGFVTMDDETEAKTAIEDLNSSTHNNRTIVVNEARERKEY
jgi:RNA recognition motif-containing protein